MLGGVIRRGVDGADAGVVGFLLCECFKFDALALTAEWSSRATCLAVIVCKPPRPNPDLMLRAERFVVHMGGEVKGRT